MQAARRWDRASVRFSLQLTPDHVKQAIRTASSIPKNIDNRDHLAAQDAVTKRNAVRSDRSRRGQQRQEGRVNSQGFGKPAPRSIHNDRDIVDPLSLENTLLAHQQANQESIIIRRARTNPSPSPTVSRDKTRTSNAALHLDVEREDVQEGRGQWEEYTGKPRALALDWEIIGDISSNLRAPWMKGLNERKDCRDLAGARLTEEIRAADLFFSPSQAEWEATNQAVKQLESFVLKANPSHVKLDIIGSRASGLATPLSDLDLNLVVAGMTDEGKTGQLKVLSQLFRSMRWGDANKGQFNTSYFTAKARVPIIVGTHISGLEFQIQSASSAYGSLEVVKSLCAEYPTMRALFKIIKHTLKMRGLSDGHLGGLTSYPLINMIAVSLKKNVNTTDPFDAGRQLLHFLKYWSTIDLYKTGITHIPGQYFKHTTASPFANSKTALESIDLVTRDPVGAKPIEFDVTKSLAEIHEGQDNFMMTLHDPANPYNDLGRSAYAIKHVQSTFMDIRAKLKKDMKEWDARIRAEGDLGQDPPSLLGSLIEGDYSLYNMERKRVAAPRKVVEFEKNFRLDARFS